jgi:cathepsin D
MAGFSVSSQGFGQNIFLLTGCRHLLTRITAVADVVSQNLLTAPVSGLLGLAWQSIASSGSMPLWQALASGGAWDSALFGVLLNR